MTDKGNMFEDTGVKLPGMEAFKVKAREAAAEGVVMLENRDHALPLARGSRAALFGRTQFHYYKSGTGSGGMVNTAYVTGVREAIEAESAYVLDEEVTRVYREWLGGHPFDAGAGWAQEPWFQEEMVPDESLVKRAAARNDAAIVILGRLAGEDRDNSAVEGSWFLTKEEEMLLERVCGAFARTIVLLNVGNIIDMTWVERYRPAAVLYIWQGGQEGGNGVLDVLTGDVSPSGKLPDTIARDIADYPSTENFGDAVRNIYKEDIYVGYRWFETFAKDRVLYPFGYGLSYTSFSLRVESMTMMDSGGIAFRMEITNTGDVPGREVVQVYCEAPQGALGKPARSLCGYRKVPLLKPGKSRTFKIIVQPSSLTSYDDSGASGFKSAWVLEKGKYSFYVGTDVRSAVFAGSIELGGTAPLEQLEEAMAPVLPFERVKPVNGAVGSEPVPLRREDPMERRAERMPAAIPYAGDLGIRLADVARGDAQMETFLSQWTDEDLSCVMRGEGMCSPKVTAGTAGAFGGVTERLREMGLPAACCADGPAGIRMDCGTIAFSLPSGTLLASTWNNSLVRELFVLEGLELRKNKIDTLLGPGMNIHRSPLNGRNFEYFSEDPYLTGKMAAAELWGLHEYGVEGTIKHFACNDQEYCRHRADSVVSERALREIYLKGFEMAVKDGGATSIMSTYGPVNGTWTASSYDLLTTILRGQWGYKGIVMTDWFAAGNEPGGAPSSRHTASMGRAQNDLFMVVRDSRTNSEGDDTMEGLAEGRVTRAELLRNAANICRFLIETPAFPRSLGVVTPVDAALAQMADSEDAFGQTAADLFFDGTCEIPVQAIDTSKGATTLIGFTPAERGIYRLEAEVCADAVSELSQINAAVSFDRETVGTIALTGADREWRTVSMELPPMFNPTFYLKFYFAQAGMKIRRCGLALVCSIEQDIIREAAKRQGTAE